MEWVDSHCHLQDDRLIADLTGVLARAAEVGVVRFFCCAGTEAEWDIIVDLARRYPCITPFLGIHPWYLAGRTPDWKDRLEGVLRELPGAGIGETGLDRAIEGCHAAEQEAVFRDHLDLARRLARPVSVHCRKAWEALVGCLESCGSLPRGCMIHSYSGSAELVDRLAARGVYFSFSGSVTRTRNRRGREACARVPADRLLLETDAPDMSPIIEGRELPRKVPNEPANLVYVARSMVRIRGMTLESLAELTTRNAGCV